METQSTVASHNGTFTDADFDTACRAYAGDTKLRRVVDAFAGAGIEDLESTIADAQSIIGLLQSMSDNGQGYTPASGKGFGSDNASTIADKLLGLGQTVGATRKSVVAWGKNVG